MPGAPGGGITGIVTTKPSAVAAEDLTTLTARVLSAYYGLLAEGRPTEWIGGHEIVQWIKLRLPDAELPSESTAIKTVAAAGLAHRRRGQPSHVSRAVAPDPPFCAGRTTPPHPRSPDR